MNNRIWLLAAGALASIAASGNAQAAEAYGNVTQEVSSKVAQEATKQTTGLISARISQAVSNVTGNIRTGSAPQTSQISVPEGEGRAAGNVDKRLAVWFNADNSWLSGEQTGADFSGTLQTAVGGVDYVLRDNLLIGTALGYEHGSFSLKYNAGGMKANNFAISPYIAYIISPNWSVEATGGHAWVNYDLNQTSGTVTGDTSGHRWFGAAKVSGNFNIDAWELGSSLGYAYLRESTDDYTLSNGTRSEGMSYRLGQIQNGYRVGYGFETDWGKIVPYAGARLEFDVNKTPSATIDNAGTKAYTGRFGTTFTLGTTFNIGDDQSLSVEGSTVQFRENLESYTLGASYRIRF